MKTLQIIVPMAGRGSRFASAGYTFPKPLIEVGAACKPMIQVVVENLGLRGHHRFFCLADHLRRYSLTPLLRLVAQQFGPVTVHSTDEVTGGQADSVMRVLKAVACEGDVGDLTDVGSPVIVANSDQYLDGWHPGAFMDLIRREDPEGAILTFTGSHPKWSFVELSGDDGRVVRVAEKDPISSRACCGVFYFKTLQILLDALQSMMRDPGNTVAGEWYLAPVYNEMIRAGQRVIEYAIPRFYGLGTPEDLQRFERLVEAGKVRA